MLETSVSSHRLTLTSRDMIEQKSKKLACNIRAVAITTIFEYCIIGKSAAGDGNQPLCSFFLFLKGALCYKCKQRDEVLSIYSVHFFQAAER